MLSRSQKRKLVAWLNHSPLPGSGPMYELLIILGLGGIVLLSLVLVKGW